MPKGKRKATKRQSAKVGKVMKEYKAHHLHSGSKHGPVVRKRSQAIAIAMREAGISKRKARANPLHHGGGHSRRRG